MVRIVEIDTTGRAIGRIVVKMPDEYEALGGECGIIFLDEVDDRFKDRIEWLHPEEHPEPKKPETEGVPCDFGWFSPTLPSGVKRVR